jgi:predicted deacylase
LLDQESLNNPQADDRVQETLKVGPYFSNNLAKIRSFVFIPYTVITGSRDGPTLCITAGVHGTEYAGIGAAIRLTNEINSKELRGKLLIVPVVDPPAFQSRSYICPIDGVDIQGSWPGNPQGSIGFQISHAVFEKLISKANYYLDLHGGDTSESEIGFSLFYKSGNEDVDEKSAGMAKALGFEYVAAIEKGNSKGSSYRVGSEHGIPSALSELGSGDRLYSSEVSAIFNGISNVMRYLRMYDEPVKSRGDQKIVKISDLSVDKSGIFYSECKPGEKISKGAVLGEIRGLRGELIDRLVAPTNGTILLMIHNPVVEAGEELITWAEL